MTVQTYTTGTVSVSDGSAMITGVGTIWSGTNVKVGDTIYLNNLLPGIEITDVTDVTHLTMAVPHVGALTNVAYTIVQNFPSRVVGVEAAKDVSTLVAALNKEGFFWFVGPDELVPDPSRGDEGQYARQPSTGKEWLKIDGLWAYQGISNPVSFDSTPYSAATTYGARALVSFGGKLYLSLQAGNLNHLPSTSPTWWTQIVAGGDTVYLAMDDSDRPDTGETVLKWICPEATTFYAGLAASYAHATIASTASAVYSVKKNGTQFATITFAIGVNFATLACASNTAFAPGDILTIAAPTPRDATLSGIGITLTGYR
jgi:hypothetical protein